MGGVKTRWYKDAVIYQIYPRSFMDSDGDGIGDIRGIISKLDYLKELGVDAVWLSPVYKSPNDDNGYDISDYRNIMDEFGTMSDWEEMIKGMHDRGIKLIMDLVVNHTSDEHMWFKESRKSKDNPYRDYYIWRKGRGKDGKKPPNNWTSCFMGPAWEYDETTGEWYLHIFSKKQPDLNWDNPKVRQEVVDICNFWLNKGVDGFRCDVITIISKAEGLPDGKWNIALTGTEKYVLGPHFEEYIGQVNRDSWSKFDTMVVGEAFGIKFETAPAITDERKPLLDMIFNFEHMETDMYMQFMPHKFKLSRFKEVLSRWQALPQTSWNSIFYENHDQPRSIPRFASNLEYHKEGAKMLAVSLLMQKGTPFIYQGQEIGMTSCEFSQDEYQDIMAKQIFNIFKKIPFAMPLARYAMSKRARDHARTPMQWSDKENAGFSSGKPWMKVNPNFKKINAENSISDRNSIFYFYKELIALRKQNEAILKGDYLEYMQKSDIFYVFERAHDNNRLLVICNFSDTDERFYPPEMLDYSSSELLISNYKDSPRTLSDSTFRPYEARIYKLK
jgi:oligo-1,6-glucosidase